MLTTLSGWNSRALSVENPGQRMSLYLYDETDGENVTVPGDDETDEDVPDEPREAHGDVGDSEGPQHLIIHPAQTDIISGD